jgi:hypothetical protein
MLGRDTKPTKCAEPPTLANSQLAALTSPDPLQIRAVKFVPSYKPCTPLSHPSSYRPSTPGRQVVSPWHITPLSSLSAYSLTALLPLPPPNPTSSTSFANRLFPIDRFPNPLQSRMLPHPPRVCPSSPTPSPPTLPSRKRAQSFAHSFRSTSLQTHP